MSQVDVAAAEAETTEGKGSRKKMLMVVVLVLVLAAGSWWWFMVRPAQADAAPEPGEVLKLDAIQINLVGGHYLRIGIALQATKDAGAELEGSKALDATIEMFTGRSVQDLAKKPYRTRLKDKLVDQLDEVYDGEVMGVYFTDFVTQ